MKVIQNKFANAILMKGYGAVTIYPFIFVRIDMKLSERMMCHELIHGRQQLEMLILPFYVWYVLEWLIRLFKNRKTAYHNLSFEREARSYELRTIERKAFGWLKFIRG